MKVLITGGTGTVGQRLMALLQAEGHSVCLLSRRPTAERRGVRTFHWDIERGFIDGEAFEGVDAIVHLAGAGVADSRWTEARKQEILNSRVHSTQLLASALQRSDHRVKAVVCASAVGYYGDTAGAIVSENTPAGQDFLAKVCQAWEDAEEAFARQGLRTVKLRIGVVLSQQGGALEKMAMPVRIGMGAPLGSGEQYLSWIHERDLVRIFLHALQAPHMQGVYNAVAPNPATNRQFNATLAEVLGRPNFLPAVPAFALKLMLGQMAEMLLGGCRASCDKLRRTGFTFDYPDLRPALRSLLDT